MNYQRIIRTLLNKAELIDDNYFLFQNREDVVGNRGCYLIGNFFIGSSLNIDSSIRSHNYSLENKSASVKFNAAFSATPDEDYISYSEPIFYLSPSIDHENILISYFKYLGFPIINEPNKTILDQYGEVGAIRNIKEIENLLGI